MVAVEKSWKFIMGAATDGDILGVKVGIKVGDVSCPLVSGWFGTTMVGACVGDADGGNVPELLG